MCIGNGSGWIRQGLVRGISESGSGRQKCQQCERTGYESHDLELESIWINSLVQSQSQGTYETNAHGKDVGILVSCALLRLSTKISDGLKRLQEFEWNLESWRRKRIVAERAGRSNNPCKQMSRVCIVRVQNALLLNNSLSIPAYCWAFHCIYICNGDIVGSQMALAKQCDFKW
jgi:hypothetical protein